MKRNINIHKQINAMDCGPACVKMIAEYYGIICSIELLREICYTSNKGTSLMNICRATKEIKIESYAVRINYDGLNRCNVLPCIAIWKGSHYVVIYKICKNIIYIADPAIGYIRYEKREFINNWTNKINGKTNSGICIIKKNKYNKILKCTQYTRDQKKKHYLSIKAMIYDDR